MKISYVPDQIEEGMKKIDVLEKRKKRKKRKKKMRRKRVMVKWI